MNAEAGPSTSTLPFIQPVGLPTKQPSGGETETTADAEQIQTRTEEGKAPVSDSYCSHFPRESD